LGLSFGSLVGLRVGSAGGLELVNEDVYIEQSVWSYPIHCSAGGRAAGFTTRGESRKCFSSSGEYLIAI